ncbi:MAG: LamG-like jellyroll fold domain-containing protein, partial [Planctomycetota bacterium]
HYYIERALVDERGRHWHIIAELPADSSTYRDAEMLSAGVAWRVRADESLFSNTAVLQVGLAGWWPLDADPADHAASDIIPDDGVAANGAALVADAERGTALALDRGEQQRLRIPDSPEVHIRDRFTLLFWIRPASDNKLGKIINKRSNLGNDGIGFTLDYQFNRLRLVTNLSHGDSIEWTPPADAWTHIAIVYDGPNQHMRLVSRTAAGVATTRLDKDDWRHLDLSVSEDWYIGGYPGDASDRHFSGGIDDVRLYQEVLTPTEIAAILAGAEAQAPRVEMEGLETSSREGGQTPALVHVVREHPDPVPLTVRYRLVAGSATQADLPSLAGLLVIPAGQRGSTLQIWPIDDLEPEETEDYRIELEADPTYSLGPQAGVDLRIEDDDDPAARRRLRLVLPADGYSVIGDPSGQEGRWRVGMGLFELEGLPNWQTHRLIISGGDG